MAYDTKLGDNLKTLLRNQDSATIFNIYREDDAFDDFED